MGTRDDVERVLISRERLAERVRGLAGEIAAAFGHDRVTVVPILSGSMIFTADLIREMPLKMRINIISVSSYQGATTVSGDLRINHALTDDLTGEPVLVVDDIFDTGKTLKGVLEYLGRFRPAVMRTAVLLQKKARQQVAMEPDFVGFQVPDEFVVGYGLDYNGFYRNLPEIGVLRPECYRPSPEKTAAGKA